MTVRDAKTLVGRTEGLVSRASSQRGGGPITQAQGAANCMVGLLQEGPPKLASIHATRLSIGHASRKSASILPTILTRSIYFRMFWSCDLVSLIFPSDTTR